MYYSIYQSLRNSAWQCLLDFKIDRLPVDVLRIARECNFHVIKNSMVQDLLPGEFGKTYYNGQAWIIIYDDLQPTVVSRYTIAHELGHIFLGHHLANLKYSEMQEFQNNGVPEKQANAFAQRLLCPACALLKFDLQTAQEIEECCRVPESVAKARAKRMKLLRERGKFLTDPVEQRLYEQIRFCKGKSDESCSSIYTGIE